MVCEGWAVSWGVVEWVVCEDWAVSWGVVEAMDQGLWYHERLWACKEGSTMAENNSCSCNKMEEREREISESRYFDYASLEVK